MDEEKRETNLEDKRDIEDDMKELKSDIATIRLELAEIRAAFFNLATEMKLMHKDFNSGIIACRQAFYRCKEGYDTISEEYENIHDGIDSAAGMISSRY